MNLYYNQEGIGDVLIIDLLDGETDAPKVERISDIAVIKDNDEKVLGYNLFNASEHLSLSEDTKGKIVSNEGLIQQLNDVFSNQGIKANFTHDPLPDFVVGFVSEKEPHPDADKLSVCKVDIGLDQPLQIVCGAPNIEQGQKVVVARVGAVMPSGMVIKDAALRGVASTGMICSARELGLPNAPTKKGILVLDESETVGKDFFGTENH